MATCNLCGEGRIMWGRTKEKNKSIPLDIPSNPNGTAWLEEVDDPKNPGQKKKVVVVASEENPKPEGARFYRLHFSHCRGYATKKMLERRLAAK